jgi:hypothetical protein
MYKVGQAAKKAVGTSNQLQSWRVLVKWMDNDLLDADLDEDRRLYASTMS